VATPFLNPRMRLANGRYLLCQVTRSSLKVTKRHASYDDWNMLFIIWVLSEQFVRTDVTLSATLACGRRHTCTSRLSPPRAPHRNNSTRASSSRTLYRSRWAPSQPEGERMTMVSGWQWEPHEARLPRSSGRNGVVQTPKGRL